MKKILAIIACSFALILTLGATENAYASQVKSDSEVRADESEGKAIQSESQLPPTETEQVQESEEVVPATEVAYDDSIAYESNPGTSTEVLNVLVNGVYTDITGVWLNPGVEPGEDRIYYGTTIDGIPVYSYDSIDWYEGTPESN